MIVSREGHDLQQPAHPNGLDQSDMPRDLPERGDDDEIERAVTALVADEGFRRYIEQELQRILDDALAANEIEPMK